MRTVASHIFPRQGAFSAHGQTSDGLIRAGISVDRGLERIWTEVFSVPGRCKVVEPDMAEKHEDRQPLWRMVLVAGIVAVLILVVGVLALRARSVVLQATSPPATEGVASAPPTTATVGVASAPSTAAQACPTSQPFPQDLANCDLQGASLIAGFPSGEDLEGANLSGSNLLEDSLQHANLTGTNLTGTNLTYADLTDANLTNANLTHAGLEGANLSGANFTEANLSGANMSGINLEGANGPPGVAYSDNPVGIIWSDTVCPDSSNSNSDGGTCSGHSGQ